MPVDMRDAFEPTGFALGTSNEDDYITRSRPRETCRGRIVSSPLMEVRGRRASDCLPPEELEERIRRYQERAAQRLPLFE